MVDRPDCRATALWRIRCGLLPSMSGGATLSLGTGYCRRDLWEFRPQKRPAKQSRSAPQLCMSHDPSLARLSFAPEHRTAQSPLLHHYTNVLDSLHPVPSSQECPLYKLPQAVGMLLPAPNPKALLRLDEAVVPATNSGKAQGAKFAKQPPFFACLLLYRRVPQLHMLLLGRGTESVECVRSVHHFAPPSPPLYSRPGGHGMSSPRVPKRRVDRAM